MQTKPTKKPLILLLLLLVLLGGVTYSMVQGGYLQGTLPGGLTLGGGGRVLTGTTTEPETSYADAATGAEALASEVAGYATDAETARDEAEAAAISGDEDALETAISDAETAAENAQSSYDEIEAYVTRAENQSEDADQAVEDGIDRQALAQGFVDLAETAYKEKIDPVASSDFEAAFELQDDYDACIDEYGSGSGLYMCSSEESQLSDAKWAICYEYYSASYMAECGMMSSMATFSSDFKSVFSDAKDLFESWGELQSNYDENFTGSYLTDLQDTADETAAALVRAQAAYDDAAADLTRADDAATEAAKYTILVCSSLTLSSETLEITDETTSVDFTVTVETGDTVDMSNFEIMPVSLPLSNGLNSLLAISSVRDSLSVGSLDLNLGHGTSIGVLGGTYEYWSGTLVVEVHSQNGEVTYDGRSDTRFDIELTEGDTLDFSFAGGEDGDTIDIYVEGETLGCSETITVTLASSLEHSLELDDTTDTDGDGLTDEEEAELGTDPTLADTDGDGAKDKLELTRGSDPLVDETAAELAERGALDTDNDGLTGDEEVALGTTYSDSDSDDDGLLDGEEVDTYSTDPLDSDSDDDDLSDLAEVQTYDTYPNDSDTDGDTYADGAEVTAGTDPLDASDYPGVSTSTTTTTTTTTTSTEVPSLTRDIILADYTCTDSFTDNDGEWHEDIVCRAKEAGWVKGYTTLLFGPDGDITRAEYVKVLTKIFGLDEEDGYDGKVGFYDVATTDWYYPYVNLAENEDWIRTRDAGYYFNPNVAITRADAILWAIRAAEQSTYTYDVEDTFTDVENDDYFAYALAIANSTLVDTADDTDQPIVEGYTDGTFGPYKNIARSEAMAIATRIAIAWGVASEDWED